MDISSLEIQLEKNVNALEKIFATHERFLENLGSFIQDYMENFEIAKPMTEAAGAEIDAVGRASRRTVFGRGGFFSRNRGKGLIHFLSAKTWNLSRIIYLINNERQIVSQQARYLQAMLYEEQQEEKQEIQMEKSAQKALKKKLKKVKAVTKKCRTLLFNIARRDKQIFPTTLRQLGNLKTAYKLSMREGAYGRRLMSFFFAPFFYKRMMGMFQKEQEAMTKFLRDEDWVVNMLMRDLRGVFDLIKEHEKLGKELKRRINFAADEKKIKEEQKVSKRIVNLMKSMKNIQKRVGKIKKSAAKYGVNISKSVGGLSSEERMLLKEEKDLEREMDLIEKLFESMQKFSTVIMRLSTNITASEIRISPLIRWANNSFITLRRISKKNPAGTMTFLDKIGMSLEKALVPALNDIHRKRTELLKDVLGEESISTNLNKGFQQMKLLVRNLDKNLGFMIKNVSKLGVSVVGGQKAALAELQASINDLQQALKDERQAKQQQKAAGLKPIGNKEADILEKIREIRQRRTELITKYRNFNRELVPLLKTLVASIKKTPRFEFISSGFFGVFGVGVANLIAKDLKLISQNVKAEEKEESIELKSLKEWLQNKSDLERYALFVENLTKVFRDELKMLNNFLKYVKSVGTMEAQFVSNIRVMELCFQQVQKGMQEITTLSSKYPEIMGGDAKEVLSTLNETVTETFRLSNELRKVETAVTTIAHATPQLRRTFEYANRNITALEKILKASVRETKKTAKVISKDLASMKL